MSERPIGAAGPLRALVVDDEPLARRGLKLRLDKRDDVVVVGEAGNGQAALDLIALERPDLLFLDVQMPGLDGFETLARLPTETMPLTIFVTAYDQYAVQAFEARAIDYLLKPVDEERLAEAMERVLQQFRGRRAEVHCERLLGLLAQWSGRPELSLDDALGSGQNAEPPNESILTLKDGHRLLRVPLAEIGWIDAAGDYLCIHAGGQTLVVRGTMKDMEERLDSRRFARIHRSTLVAVDRVRALHPHLNGEYFLLLEGGQKLKLSRSYRDRLELFRPRAG
jgi:two-component system LytT family response regulator